MAPHPNAILRLRSGAGTQPQGVSVRNVPLRRDFPQVGKRPDGRIVGWSDRRMVGNLLTFLSPIRLAIRRPGSAGLHPVSPDAPRCFVVQLSKIEPPKGWDVLLTRFP